MQLRSIAFVAAALLLSAVVPLKSFAEDDAKMSAAQIAAGQTKAGVANTLIIIGRSAKDPDMLMAAAKLLAAIDAPVADPKASADGGKPVFYDVDAIVVEADGYAANRSAKPTSRTYAGFCHYEYLCDSLSCSYVWVC
jgi:hypothetical protein